MATRRSTPEMQARMIQDLHHMHPDLSDQVWHIRNDKTIYSGTWLLANTNYLHWGITAEMLRAVPIGCSIATGKLIWRRTK
jgi:hypothetical protein